MPVPPPLARPLAPRPPRRAGSPSPRLPGWSRLLGVLLLLLPAAGGAAEPLRLADPAPRWVAVRFEISPAAAPGQLDHRYSEPLHAWLEPLADPNRVRVRVPGPSVALRLFGDQNPEPESFSDFVWEFDAASGAVLSAAVSGTVRPELHLGFVRSRTRAEVEVSMTTLEVGGFEPTRRVLGQTVHRFCRVRSPRCRTVETARLDPETGYVNAVGPLRVRSRWAELEQFSPLGEAIFEELPPSHAAHGAPPATVARSDS